MIGMGDGIAIFAVCGTIVAGMIRFIPRRNGNGVVSKTLCDERSGNIKEDIVEIKRNTTALLKHFKIKE